MAIVSGPQNVGLPGYTLAAKPKPKKVTPAVNDVGGVKGAAATRSTYSGGSSTPATDGTPNGFGNLGIEGSGFATSQNPAPAAAAATTTPAAPDWKSLVANDPEGILQHQYLDQDNTLTTAALRKAWLQHTQASQDSYNAHGALFSGAAANANRSIASDYDADSARQALTYDKGGHDINTSVFNRLMKALTDTGTTDGTTL